MSITEVYEPLFNNEHEILKLGPSAKFILYLLKQKGPMNRKRIIFETMMPDRTVGFALRMLLQRNLIEKVDSLTDNKEFSQGRHKKHKIDHRITNYRIISSILPIEMEP